MAEEMTSRERWAEWEKRSGYEREKGGAREGAQQQEPGEGRQKVLRWAEGRLAGAEKLADPKKREKFKERVSEFIVGTAKLQTLIREGKIQGNIQEHMKYARAAQEKHEASLKTTLQDLQALAPEGSTVMGRVKTEGSMIGKVARKPKYGRPDRLQDITGTTVVVDNLSGTKHVLDGIKGKFKVVGEDDYVSKPQPGHYRAHHLVIETEDGLQKEVQVKTKRQIAFSKWSHDVYKPQNTKQSDALKRHGATIDSYAKAMSDHLYALDRGMLSNAPPCPEESRAIFGCVPAA